MLGVEMVECIACGNKAHGIAEERRKFGLVALDEVDGGYELSTTQLVAVTPLICNKCGYVMLYDEKIRWKE